jgi:hypothetical protein
MGLRATQGDEKWFLFSNLSLSGSAPLPFVISTEAQRSGEISMWMLFLGNVFLAERSVVEPAVSCYADSQTRALVLL